MALGNAGEEAFFCGDGADDETYEPVSNQPGIGSDSVKLNLAIS